MKGDEIKTLEKPIKFLQKPFEIRKEEELIKPFIFEEKPLIKSIFMDMEYAYNSEKKEAKTDIEKGYAGYCNYQIFPVCKNVYIDRNGNALYERESFASNIIIDGTDNEKIDILTSDISNITTIIAKRFSSAILNGSKKEARIIENLFRQKTKGINVKKIYIEHGWQLIDGKMQYLDDSKNGILPLDIKTGLSLPLQQDITGKDVYSIFKNALSVYGDKPTISTMVLFSLLGVSFKLFEEAGYMPRFVLFINGKTGSMKTTLSKILYMQLTDEKHRNTVRRIDSDTIVSFERALVKSGRDTTTLFDDYAPAKTAQKKTEMQNKLEAIIRMVGDGSTKSRSNEKLQDVQGDGVHGAVVITGELRGKGLSSNLRCVYCMIDKSNVNLELVNWFQKNANYYTSFISIFTQYLSLNWDREICYIKDNFNKERDQLCGVLKEKRLIDSCVTLRLLADMLKRFFYGFSNIIKDDIEQIINSMKEDVILNIKLSEELSIEENPSTEFIKAIDVLIDKGCINIGTKEEFIKTKNFDGFEEKGYMYLLPAEIIAKVSQYYRNLNRYWNMDVSDVLGMLFEDKIIKSYSNGNNKRTYLARVVVEKGKKQGFIKISKEVYSAIIDDKYEA